MNLSLSNLFSKESKQKNSEPSVLEKRWGTIISLVGIFVLALFLRSYFAFDIATKYGVPYLVSGGSDAYYYGRIINFIQENHYHLLTDSLRRYPLGGGNPRPPLFAWSVVLGGSILSPLVGNVNTAISYVFILSTGFWGALTIFPTYLIGRNAFGKKAGLTAAFLLAISSGHLQRSVITNGDHDAMYLFFAVTAFYFFMRSLQDIDRNKNWVLDWTDWSKIKEGLLEFITENKRSLLYAAMSGVAIGSVALTWKGYPYVIVIILVYFAFQLLFDKFTNKDSLGVTACIFVSLAIAFILAGPYYYGAGIGASLPYSIGKWYDIPLLLFLFAFAVGVFFTVTRDYPWLVIISILAIGLAIFFVIGSTFYPGLINSLLSGAGYFIQNKLYSTIAEAQAPPFSNLVLSFGIVSFFLSLAGIGLALWHLKGQWNADFIFILIWTAFAIYMAMSAARFIFNSSPAFALTAGWVLALIADKADFGEIARRFRSFRGDFFRGIYEGFKIKHVLAVLFVAFLIMMPNAMYALDAGIPYEDKEEYNDQIYKSLPATLQPPNYNTSGSGLWYLGAFGYSMDKPTEYWPAAWDWLSEQDNDQLPKDRPAFLSWWDYGFECIREGDHPTVADNFQVGYRLAGNVLMAQNESEIISLLISRELEKPFSEEGEFKGEVREILVNRIGEEKTEELEDVYKNPASYKKEVLNNPERYHPRADDIHPENVKYAKVMGLLSYESVYTLSELYRELSLHLDIRIKYLAVDSRLFPFSARQSGIFYAPAKLSGHRLDESQGMNTPIDFYTIKYVTNTGQEFDDPDDVPPQLTIQEYRIDYKPMFYNSTLYRIMVGYSGSDIGQREGIPSLDRALQRQQPLPAWNMSHFKLTYRTAYYNPYKDFKNHSEEWRAVSLERARELNEEDKGTVDLSGRSYLQHGVAFLEYFDGAIIRGKVTTKEGKPIENAQVTVLDDNFIPHNIGKTDENGNYEVYAPSGKVNIIATIGGKGRAQLQTKSITLNSTEMNISESQAMREKIDRNGDGVWDYIIKEDFKIDSSSIKGKSYVDHNGDDQYDSQNDTLIPGKITLTSKESGDKTVIDSENGEYSFEEVAPGRYSLKTDIKGAEVLDNFEIKPNEDVTKDIEVSSSEVRLNVTFDNEVGSKLLEVTAIHKESGKDYSVTITEEGDYTFDHIIPGDYLLNVKTEGYTLKSGPIKFGLEKDTAKNVTGVITEATTLKGKTTLNGNVLSNQKLSFIGLYNDYTQTITSNDHGDYEIKLPDGDYRVYGTYMRDNKKFIAMGIISTPEDNNFIASFDRTHELTGKAIFDGEQIDGFDILLKHESGGILKTTASEGDFSINVVEGEYDCYASKSDNINSILAWKKIVVNEDKSITLYGKSGKEIRGNIYRDLNNDNSYDAGEGIQTNIDITYNGEKIFTTESSREGEYNLVVPENDYELRIWKEGYEAKTVSISGGLQENIRVSAEEVSIEGEIISDWTYNDLPIQFKSVGNGAISKTIHTSNSEFLTSLNPGTYKVMVDYQIDNGDKALQFEKEVEVNVGETNKEIEPIVLKENVKLKGSVRDQSGLTDSKITFKGPETISITTSGNYELYLEQGTYSIRAINQEKLLSKQLRYELDDVSTLDITLERMVDFSVMTIYQGSPKSDVELTFENIDSGYKLATKTDDVGETIVSLTPGNYKVSVNHITTETIDGVLKKVRYTYSETFYLNSSAVRQISLDREIVESTVEGKITYTSSPADNIEVEFLALNTAAESTSTYTNSEGEFTVDLTSGTYSIYANYKDKRLYSILDTFEMGIENRTIDISLKEGVKIEGTTKVDGTSRSSKLEISNLNTGGEKALDVDDDGYYSIILPKAEYQIKASTEIDSGAETYEFIETKYVDLDNSRVLNFELKMVKTYGIQISDVPRKTAEQGDELKYIISVKNTGNTEDTFKLSAVDSGWDIGFSNSKFSLGPEKSQQIELTVYVKDNATVSHPPIRFKASSMNSNKEVTKTIPIDVKQVYGVKLKDKIIEKSFEKGTLSYKIELTNTGNGVDSFELEIVNKKTLERNGWKANIQNSTDDILSGRTIEIELTLKAVSPNPSEEVNVEITAISNRDTDSVDTNQYKTELPAIRGDIGSFTIEGDNIFLQREEFSLKTWQWVMIIFTVGFIALYVSRKERWI